MLGVNKYIFSLKIQMDFPATKLQLIESIKHIKALIFFITATEGLESSLLLLFFDFNRFEESMQKRYK